MWVCYPRYLLFVYLQIYIYIYKTRLFCSLWLLTWYISTWERIFSKVKLTGRESLSSCKPSDGAYQVQWSAPNLWINISESQNTKNRLSTQILKLYILR